MANKAEKMAQHISLTKNLSSFPAPTLRDSQLLVTPVPMGDASLLVAIVPAHLCKYQHICKYKYT